jgi:serine/threonine protein kinase
LSQRASWNEPTMQSGPHPGEGGTGSPTVVGSDTPVAPGSLIGGYRILEPLGEGGMGHVFVAQHPRLSKRVAVKVLRREFASNPSALKRFYQEAQAASQIENPHIVQVFDFGEDAGVNFIAMELLNGADLAQVRLRDGPFPLARIVSILRQVSAGLAAAHDRGIIHRDLKPENVFLVRDEGQDYVKLLDFGLAKLSEHYYQDAAKSQSGMIMGTPDYMSPEQAIGTGVDVRTDIYSLATLVYWMIADRIPFRTENANQALVVHATQDAPPLPSAAASGELVPPALRDVVARALVRQPERRTGSVREFVQAMEAALAGAPAARDSRTADGAASATRFGRRWRLVLPVIGILLVILAVGWRLLASNTPDDAKATRNRAEKAELAGAPPAPPLPAPAVAAVPPPLPALPPPPAAAKPSPEPAKHARPGKAPHRHAAVRPKTPANGAADDDLIMPSE